MTRPHSNPRTLQLMRRWRRGSVRRRVLATSVATAVLSVVLFAVPLGVALQHFYRAQAMLTLQREAADVSLRLTDDALVGHRAVRIPPPRAAHVRFGLYDATGRRFDGVGPANSGRAAATARSHNEFSGTDANGDLVALLPVAADDGSAVVIRAGEPTDRVTERVEHTWLLMAVLAVGVIAISTVLAARRAARISRPIERFARDARDLGDGDFTITPVTTGVLEADDASQALATTARRVGRLLQREREFTADASHQLRTPLTRLRIRLEAAALDPDADLRGALEDAVVEIDALEASIGHLLAIVRESETGPGSCDAGSLVRRLAEHWQPLVRSLGRELVVSVAPSVPPVKAPAMSMRHVLDVLVDNAVQHGAGRIEVNVRISGDAVALDVADEGNGLADADELFVRRGRTATGNGIGLPVARQVIEAAGGRIVVTRAAPNPVFTVLVPAAVPAGQRAVGV